MTTKPKFPIPLKYKGVKLNCGYRIDFLIDDYLCLEIKTVEKIIKLHHAQILTYMKLTKLNLGLLINFNSVPLKNGLKRFII